MFDRTEMHQIRRRVRVSPVTASWRHHLEDTMDATSRVAALLTSLWTVKKCCPVSEGRQRSEAGSRRRPTYAAHSQSRRPTWIAR